MTHNVLKRLTQKKTVPYKQTTNYQYRCLETSSNQLHE